MISSATAHPDRPAALCIRLLGGFCAEVGGRPVPPAAWRLRKARHLAALLALAPGCRLPREWATDALWPDLAPEAAANNLRVALHAARRALAPASLPSQGGLLLLSPEAPVWVDAAAFEAAAAAARRARDPAAGWAAVELYAGDLLPEEVYEDWLGARREALRTEHLGLLGELAAWEEARGERGRAIAALERSVAHEPTAEAAHRALMRLLAETGQRGLALRQYERLRDALRAEMEAEPEAATRALYREIAGGALVPALPTPPPDEGRPPGNLPLALTSFVGRQRELAEARRLLSETRLLTLTGAGGVGKTRLALELARAIQADYPDGAWWVDLGGLTDAELVPHTVAGALGAPERPGRSVSEALVAWLGGRAGLVLVLDNCEHLADACAALAWALLAACAGVRILATSREPLGIAGETTWRVPSLALPDPAGRPALAEVAQCSAIRLFVERAGAALPSFALTAGNAAAVAEVCRRLDGIPLAIELAAARVRTLGVDQLAARLDDAFRLLTVGSRAALPRQRTLRATIDWSYALLSEPERALLRRLAVFAGGWTLDAAEAVCAGDGVAGPDVLDVLLRLVDKSLVIAEPGTDGQMRCRLLETMRQYADERLGAAGEAPALHWRRCQWCLGLADLAEPALQHSDVAWLDRLEVEHENLRATLRWCLEHDPEAGLQVAGAIWPFWLRRGYISEGRRWLESLLVRAQESTARRARALLGAAMLAREQWDLVTGREWFEAGLAMSRALRDPRLTAWILRDLGQLLLTMGEYPRARAVLEEGLMLVRGADDRLGLSANLLILGGLAEIQGDYERAQHLFEESLAAGREVGDDVLIGNALDMLGTIALVQGDDTRAQALYEEALAVARHLGSPWQMAMVQEHLGRLARWRGDVEQAAALHAVGLEAARATSNRVQVAWHLSGLAWLAEQSGDTAHALELFTESRALHAELRDARGVATALLGLGRVLRRRGDAAASIACLRESLDIWRGFGRRPEIAGCLESLALVTLEQGDPARAVRWLSAAAALREALGGPLAPVERPDYEATLQASRATLADAPWSAAWAAGRDAPLEQIVAEALVDVAPPCVG